MKVTKDMFNQMTVTADDKKSQKGDGINSVLKFMIDVRDFQDKLDTCVDSQAIAENKAEIAKYSNMIDDLYKSLAGIASTSVRSMREESAVDIEPEDEVKRESPNPVMVNAPQIPKM